MDKKILPMLRRMVAAVLIAIMLVTLVAGCGKKAEDGEVDIFADGSLNEEKHDTTPKPDGSKEEETDDKTEKPTEDTDKPEENKEDTDKPTDETPSDTDKTEPETPDAEQKDEQKEPTTDEEKPSEEQKEPEEEQKPEEKPEPEQPQVTVTVPDITSVAEMNAQQALIAMKGLPYVKLMEAWIFYQTEDNADSRYGIYTLDQTNIRVDYDENNLITGVSFEAVEDEEETEEE